MKQKKHGSLFRCDVCGKFIAYAEIDKDEAITTFIPDTYYTVEQTIFTHKKCEEQALKK